MLEVGDTLRVIGPFGDIVYLATFVGFDGDLVEIKEYDGQTHSISPYNTDDATSLDVMRFICLS